MALIPANPLETDPIGKRAIPHEEWGHVLIELLIERGVKIGQHDDRIISWLAGWDWSTVGTILSWLVAMRDDHGQAVQGPGARPGDMVQDDDGSIYVHCADGRLRLVADEAPYNTLAELDNERGPLLPVAEAVS